MTMLKKIITVGMALVSLGASAETQYKPFSSLQRHEISLGDTFNKGFLDRIEGIGTFKDPDGLFLEYGFLLRELNQYIPKPYQNIFVLSLNAGVSVLDKEYGKNYDEQPSFCEDAQSLIYNGALKGKLDYFEYIKFFAEWGLTKSSCIDYTDLKNFKFKPASKATEYYYSVGGFLSFKVLNKTSIYSLDRDYGINDMGLLAKCFWISFKDDKKDSSTKIQSSLAPQDIPVDKLPVSSEVSLSESSSSSANKNLLNCEVGLSLVF